MRRFWAMLLLGILGLPLIGPALAVSPSETELPACCRRDGKHGCGMLEAKQSAPAGPAWQAGRCPSFPTLKGLPAARTVAVAPENAELIADAPPTLGTVQAQAETLYRISHSRVRQKRGPPTPA